MGEDFQNSTEVNQSIWEPEMQQVIETNVMDNSKPKVCNCSILFSKLCNILFNLKIVYTYFLRLLHL